MPQGALKTKAPANPHKRQSTTQKKSRNPDAKKGQRTIAPKKVTLVSAHNVLRNNTKNHSSSIEKTVAAQALSHGKLTIMRKAAEEVKDKKEKEGGK
ncbi:hypothetical protein JCM10213_007115 [Rhodosporidiobolus nylandii]